MKNLKIFLVALFGLSILSCTRKDENSNCQRLHPYDIMQRVKMVNNDGDWISGIKEAKVELIAYDFEWKNPLLDENGNIIKQIHERIEAKKKVDNTMHWIELYMESSKHWREKPGVVPDTDSYFILKVNNDSFKIRSNYLLDFCRRNILISFFFDEKQYPISTLPVDITIP